MNPGPKNLSGAGTGAVVPPASDAPRPLRDALAGVLIGTATGDALGLPMEGVGPVRQRCLFPGPWRMRLVLGRGMLSDDTELSYAVAQALSREPADPARFRPLLPPYGGRGVTPGAAGAGGAGGGSPC